MRQTYDPVESLCLTREEGEAIYYPLRAIDVYAEEYKHFAQVVTQNVLSPIDAKISYANQSVIDTAYRSLESVATAQT